MEILIEDYFELERLGLDIKRAKEIAKDCKNIRSLEYKLYLDAREIHQSIRITKENRTSY